MLDWIFTYAFLSFFLIGLGLYYILSITFKIEKGWIAITLFFGLILVIPFLSIMYGLRAGWGYLKHKNIEQFAIHDHYLVIRDYSIGRGGRNSYDRLYWIDLEKGEVVFKEKFKKPDVLSYSDKFIYFNSDKGIYILDITSGKTLERLSENDLESFLPEEYQELDSYEFDPKSLTIKLIDKKGREFEHSLSDFYPETTPPIASKGDFVQYENIYYENDFGRTKNFQLKGDKRKVLVDDKGKTIEPEQVFIAGKFLGTFEVDLKEKEEVTVVQSYETLDKDNYVLSVLNEKGKLLWKFQGKEADIWWGNSIYRIFPYQDELLFLIKDRLFSFQAQTGKLNWKMRI